MTYNVFSGTLNLYSINQSHSQSEQHCYFHCRENPRGIDPWELPVDSDSFSHLYKLANGWNATFGTAKRCLGARVSTSPTALPAVAYVNTFILPRWLITTALKGLTTCQRIEITEKRPVFLPAQQPHMLHVIITI